MNEELRKKAKRSLIAKLITFAVIIAICLVVTKCSFIDLIKGPFDLTETANWSTEDIEDLEGKYVTIDVDTPLLCFAEEYSKNTKTGITTTTSLCYACELYDVETANGYIYGVKADKGRAEDFEERFSDYTEGNTFRITGTFTKMKGEMLNYYEESIMEEYEELWQFSIPYCIYDQTIGGLDYILAFILYGVIVISLLVMIISTIRYCSGSHMRYMNKYIANNTRETMQGLEADFLSANVIAKNYRIGRKYLFYAKGGTINLLPLSTQIWAYYYKRTGKNAVSQLRFYDINKKETCVNIPENPAHEVLQLLSTQCAHMVIGYDEGLMNTYKQAFDSFLNIKYNAQRETAASQENNWNFDK